MLYHTYAPGPPLAGFVERFWQCSDAPSHDRERILPSGTVELVINLREDEIRIYDPRRPERCTKYSGAVVSGPYRGCFLIDPLQHASILGVHFGPGGAVPFLGLPANELADRHLDLETLWGRAASDLRERLCAATTAEQRFALLADALVARLQRPPKRHGAVTLALETFDRTAGGARIGEVARRAGLSQRRLIQVFAAEVGLTPKLYCRVRRFQQARQVLQSTVRPDWSLLAAGCGYFDQSHLIRDFQAFSGLSPVTYLRQSNAQVLPNHIAQLP